MCNIVPLVDLVLAVRGQQHHARPYHRAGEIAMQDLELLSRSDIFIGECCYSSVTMFPCIQ